MNRKRCRQEDEVRMEDSDVEMAEDTKKALPKTMTDEERRLMVQSNHELQPVATVPGPVFSRV